MENLDVIRDNGDDVPSVTSSSNLSTSSEFDDVGPTLAIIGCGPGGLSFLHAISHRRKELQENGDEDGLRKLPSVTVFEKNSAPGGVWMSAVDSSTSKNKQPTGSDGEGSNEPSTKMYEGLWINGCKEALEYSDYTFDEHFGKALPVYLPRSQVLEYMMARMTRHEDILENVQFNTTVESVNYYDAEKEFVFTITDETGETRTQTFDKCIFAGGMNGSAKYAGEIKSMLQNQNFSGQVAHSSEMNKLGPCVEGKRIVLVGDSYSAEDLALQCLKLGAEKIYITSRRSSGSASYTGAWPNDKIESVWYRLPFAVQDGSTILCRKNAEDDEIRAITEVSIVIFCTGYNANIGMLSPELQPYGPTSSKYPTFSVPSDWKMKDNCLTDIVGHIDPPSQISLSSTFVNHRIYKRMLIDNPNMMYLYELSSYPLIEIDIAAWLCLAHICGDQKIPSQKEMRRKNQEFILEEMQELRRYEIDSNYENACKNIPKDHWYYNTWSEEYGIYSREYETHYIKRMSRDQRDAGYPVQYGNGDELNGMGKQLLEMCFFDSQSRIRLESGYEESEWKTFRDTDPSKFSSLFTGTKAVPLKGRWLDLDNEGNKTV